MQDENGSLSQPTLLPFLLSFKNTDTTSNKPLETIKTSNISREELHSRMGQETHLLFLLFMLLLLCFTKAVV